MSALLDQVPAAPAAPPHGRDRSGRPRPSQLRGLVPVGTLLGASALSAGLLVLLSDLVDRLG
jgi:hypothetical protein